MITLRYTAACPQMQSFMGNSVAQRNQRRSRPNSTACVLSSNQTTPCPREASTLSSFLVRMTCDCPLQLADNQLMNNIHIFQTALIFFLTESGSILIQKVMSFCPSACNCDQKSHLQKFTYNGSLWGCAETADLSRFL